MDMINDLSTYLQSSSIIDFYDTNIATLAQKLAEDSGDKLLIARRCFEYVRDQIAHTGDSKNPTPTCKASEVLEYKTGWCYAKSHLLAALLRANHIPTGFCYQRLFCNEYHKDSYCLHGLNAIYLQEFGWYRVDARGNKEGVDAQFTPPHEKLAFNLIEGEKELQSIYSEPLEVVVTSLREDYQTMITNFPDIVCS